MFLCKTADETDSHKKINLLLTKNDLREVKTTCNLKMSSSNFESGMYQAYLARKMREEVAEMQERKANLREQREDLERRGAVLTGEIIRLGASITSRRAQITALEDEFDMINPEDLSSE